MEQLLGLPGITSSTRLNQVTAAFEALVWFMKDNIEALYCDSTANNTGRLNGACVELEWLLKKDLLYLICRHHIFELVLRCIFEKKFGNTVGPEVHPFKNFESFWSSIDQTNYDTGINDSFVSKSLGND